MAVISEAPLVGVRLSKARPRQCRWIDSNGNKDPFCCGEPVVGHSSWCKEHLKKVFLNNQDRAKARMKHSAKTQGPPRMGSGVDV
jgi:hypothetical protein